MLLSSFWNAPVVTFLWQENDVQVPRFETTTNRQKLDYMIDSYLQQMENNVF